MPGGVEQAYLTARRLRPDTGDVPGDTNGWPGGT